MSWIDLDSQSARWMAIPAFTNQVVDSLDQYDDVVSWINDTLSPNDAEDFTDVDLAALDQEITQLLSTLDVASEDTSAQLERAIDDISRGIPRLAYDLHFMKDGASTLQSALIGVLQRSKDAIPNETSAALDNLHHLDTIKGRMEAAREVLREAESWSTLEHEVTSLIQEKSYAKAAERLSEANKSMVVFQNTPEYDPRRALMVNLQNQLEAALSTALISAINSQDLSGCRDYYSIFSTIQRESEFRNYYYASRRAAIVSFWQNNPVADANLSSTSVPIQNFPDFLQKFYSTFLSVLNTERVAISSIFPDPASTLSQFISSTITSLQPSVSQCLSSYAAQHGESVLIHLIPVLRETEDFATGVEKVMEKVKYASSSNTSLSPTSTAEKPQSHRRRSSRMSISLRPGQHRSLSSTAGLLKAIADSSENLEWEQELFQPFLDFQTDYAALERRYLDHSLLETISSDTRDKIQASDRPRLFRERAVDVFGIAENSMARCKTFTYGYGAVGLIQALDGFFQSFIDMWTVDLQTASSNQSSVSRGSVSDNELSDLDYTAQDWSNIQLSLHFLSSARVVSDRLANFETKLRAYLGQVATLFRMAANDPLNFPIAATKGESQLLEQSTLNSTELHALLTTVEADPSVRDPPYSASLRLQTPISSPSEPLLVNARKALSTFAQTCQTSMTKTILSPLRGHLTGYASSSGWLSAGDPKVATSNNDLPVPTFSLSHSETVQRVAEGLLNLPRLFEVYADDDALAFSLETLPFVEAEMLQSLTEQTNDMPSQQSHQRRSSVYTRPNVIDSELVSSAWLISLGHTFLDYLVSDVLPAIPSLSIAGAAQLASDLEYLSNIVRALNVEHGTLEKWKAYISMDKDDGMRILNDNSGLMDPVLERVAKLRGWR